MASLSVVNAGDRPMVAFVRPYVNNNCSVLDLGCGDCSFVTNFPLLNKKLYCGIDKDKKKCVIARKKGYFTLCKNIDKYRKNVLNGTYDIIVAKDILEHCNNPELFVKFMYAHLKKKGDLFISVPSELSLLIWDDYTHKRGFSKQAIQQILRHNGFSVIHFAKDHSLINISNCPLRYIILWIFYKLTSMDFITQCYLVHAKKTETDVHSCFDKDNLQSQSL
jgi:2-polyprenyl-3-methyl-5-hydroxy-6-metoxy-1,4-benzoquinol methylase